MSNSRPTLMQIIPRLDTGGAELSTLEMTEAIVKAGGTALVVSEGGRLSEAIRDHGGRIIELPVASKNPAVILANSRRLHRLAKREHISLIHVRSRAPAWSARFASRALGVPFVTTYHGAYGETNHIKRFYNSVMASGDRVIANSRFTADLIASRYATPLDRLRVIYRGVDVDRFDQAAIDPAQARAMRAQWGVGDGKILLNAARLTGWKGQQVIIEAARLLSARNLDACWQVVLAGDAQGRSAYADGLRRQIGDAGLTDRVHLIGHCDDMASAFSNAHAAIIASTEPEAFGRTVAEAQAIGCPVIATRLGAPQETVLTSPPQHTDDITGWLIEPGDAVALADAMASALTLDAGSYARLGNNAAAHIRRNYTTWRMQHQTLAVYDELLGTQLADNFTSASNP